MLQRLVACIAAVGCRGGPPTPPAHVATPAPTAVPAALYAGLFVEGTVFRYRLEARSSYWDDQDPRANPQGEVEDTRTSVMTCKVEGVERLASRIVAELHCDDDLGVPVGDAGPQGVYVATADGLWRVASRDQAQQPLASGALILPADPVETPPAPDATGGAVSRYRGGDGSWCRTDVFVSGDEGGTTICLGDGAVVSGSASSAGGSSREAHYSLITP
jgi:hypothetical protein